MNRTLRIGAVLIAALLLGGAATGLVLAQDGDGPGSGISSFISKLAENLGITEEELDAAIDETQLEIVDEAVAEGKLTEDQAGNIRERIESGEGSGFFGGFRGGFGKGFGNHGFGIGYPGASADALAELLGITVDELRSAQADGQTLAAIAEANGVSRTDLVDFLVGEAEDQIAAKVDEGRIDQDQASELLADLGGKIEMLVDSTMRFRPGRWHGGSSFPSHQDGTHETEGVVF